MNDITLDATRQYIDLEGYMLITREKSIIVCDDLRFPFGLHNTDAISLYKLFLNVFTIRPSFHFL